MKKIAFLQDKSTAEGMKKFRKEERDRAMAKVSPLSQKDILDSGYPLLVCHIDKDRLSSVLSAVVGEIEKRKGITINTQLGFPSGTSDFYIFDGMRNEDDWLYSLLKNYFGKIYPQIFGEQEEGK